MSQPWLPWQPTGPQPETCELCGRLVNGASLMESQAEGLEGLRICGENPSCAELRIGLPSADKKVQSVVSTIGQGRVYLPGGPLPWEGAE